MIRIILMALCILNLTLCATEEIKQRIPFEIYNRNKEMSDLEFDRLKDIIKKYEGEEYADIDKNQARISLTPSETFANSKILINDEETTYVDELMETFFNNYTHKDTKTHENFIQLKEIFKDHVINPIGRELVYRIMTKIGAYGELYLLLKAIKNKPYCYEQLLTKLDLYIIKKDKKVANNDDINNNYDFYRMLHDNDLLQLLLNYASSNDNTVNIPETPIKQPLKQHNGLTIPQPLEQLKDTKQYNHDNKIDTANLKISVIISSLKKYINNLKVTIFLDDEDSSFDYANNIVHINKSKNSYLNIVDGPVIRKNNYNEIETRWINVGKDSTLHHEIGHYFHVILENCAPKDSLTCVSIILSNNNIVHKLYLENDFDNHWHYQEELREIFGIHPNTYKVRGQNITVLEYDYINQSQYNIAKLSNGSDYYGVRYGHYGNRLIMMPYKLFHAVYGLDNFNPTNMQYHIDNTSKDAEEDLNDAIQLLPIRCKQITQL